MSQGNEWLALFGHFYSCRQSCELTLGFYLHGSLRDGRAELDVDRSFHTLTKAASAAFCCSNYLFLPHISNIFGSNLVALMNKVHGINQLLPLEDLNMV